MDPCVRRKDLTLSCHRCQDQLAAVIGEETMMTMENG
jgi:hypothetical protein